MAKRLTWGPRSPLCTFPHDRHDYAYTVERYAPGDVLEIAKCRRCGARREQRYYTDERGVDHKAHPRFLPGVGNSSDV